MADKTTQEEAFGECLKKCQEGLFVNLSTVSIAQKDENGSWLVADVDESKKRYRHCCALCREAMSIAVQVERERTAQS